jgi:hypothetical protein
MDIENVVVVDMGEFKRTNDIDMPVINAAKIDAMIECFCSGFKAPLQLQSSYERPYI